jgi:pyruvate dehydrogenase E2 component (dihydrolipoamide acetyltransferase)
LIACGANGGNNMASTDFVMPKLGLTMTEGTIARWDVAPGKTFAQGDIILVVETDKIAYDVEAPASGVLQEVLVSAGSAVPVGTPIGRWDVGDIKVSLDAPDAASTKEEPAVAPEASETPSAVLPQQRRADAGRTLATPYARRLARQAGIDLHRLDGSGPRGRIKAADVERAITAQAAAPAQTVAPAPAQTARAATYSAGIDIDVTALLKLAGGINNDIPDLHAELAHFVALAAAKVPGVFSGPIVIGFVTNRDSGDGTASLLAGADCRTLRGLIAQSKDALAAEDAAGAHGLLWIESALEGISFVSADPPSGWAASLVVGAVREGWKPDAEGRAVHAPQLTIVLTAQASAFDQQQGQRFLRELRRLLEAPLLLLAT